MLLTRLAALFILSSTLSVSLLSAQTLYGSLVGNVTDSSGAGVPRTRIEALNLATGVIKTTTTDERGGYTMSDLLQGTYKITVSAAAFSPRILDQAAITVNNVLRLDVSLSVSQVSEAIVVGANAAVLQTDRADVNNVLSTKQISELPIINSQGRNFQALYKILPGFTPPAEAHSDSGNPQRSMVTQANGLPQSSNNTKLDGATVSHPWLPRLVAYVPAVEAIETVNIVSNSFDAEQGMAGGAAANVIIKSGTNQFHGAGWIFHNNSAIKARNYFYCLYACTGDPNQPPKNLQNQFGGTIGGPIIKNKLFFFSDWERTTRRQSANALRTVPTAALRTGDFNGTNTTIFDPSTGALNGSGRTPFPNNRIPTSQIDPAAAILTGLIPQLNQPGIFPNNYLVTAGYQFRRDNVDFKVNYNASEKLQMFARYSFSPTLVFDPPSLGQAGGDATNGGQPGTAPGLIQSTAVGGTYLISKNIIIDGVIGFTRLRLSAKNVDLDRNYGLDVLKIPGTNGTDPLQAGYPRFTFNQFSSLGNPNVSNPFLFRDNQYVTNWNVGWNKGAHNIRFGFEYLRFDINHFQPQASNGPRGGFNFTGGITSLQGGPATTGFNSWADFLLGLPASMGKDVQYLNPATVRMPSIGLYIRDAWQVTRKLTVDYGIRYELFQAPRRDHSGGERYDPNTDRVVRGGYDVGRGQLAPRLGIAYRIDEKSVLRIGAGISVDPTSFRYLRDAYPATISTQFSGTNAFQPAGTLRTGLPPFVGPDLTQSSFTLPPAVGTTTFPQKYNRGYIGSWNVTYQRDLYRNINLQTGYVGSRGIRQTVIQNINAAGPGGGNPGRALFPSFGRISNVNYFNPFNSSNYNGWLNSITRRFSGATLGLSYTLSRATNYGDDQDSGLNFNWVPMLQRNKAVAGFDRTHNLQVYGNYDLPFGKGRSFASSSKFVNLLSSGWQVNWILSRTSGVPFTVLASGSSLNAPGNTQTADQILGEVTIPGGHGVGEPYFNPNAFAPVVDVRFGNSGRNLLRGPGLFNIDAGLFRTFNVTERVKLQFRTEMFGVTNTPAFGNPGTNVSNVTRNADGSIRALNGFGEITTATGERQIRFALRLSF